MNQRTGRLGNLVMYVIMVAAAALAIMPLAWVLVSAIRPEGQILVYPPRWVPATVSLENFHAVLGKYNFARWMLNSLVVAVASTAVTVLLDAMAGYALARLRFAGRSFLFAMILSMLLVPIQVTVVPLFLMFSEVHRLDTLSALILPTTATVTGVFLMRQFFLSIPADLEEAAKIDGCGPFRIWWQIILPLAGPALSAVGSLTFVNSWNNFLWPLISVSSDRSRTLPVGIAQYMGAASGASGSAPSYGPPLASAVMATIPALIVFLALQRYFVQGVSFTGLKG